MNAETRQAIETLVAKKMAWPLLDAPSKYWKFAHRLNDRDIVVIYSMGKDPAQAHVMPHNRVDYHGFAKVGGVMDLAKQLSQVAPEGKCHIVILPAPESGVPITHVLVKHGEDPGPDLTEN